MRSLLQERSKPPRRVVVIVDRFRSTSETFITNELKMLEQQGCELHIVSLADPPAKPLDSSIRAPVIVLPGMSPARVVVALAVRAIRRPQQTWKLFSAAKGCTYRGVRGLWQACFAVAASIKLTELLSVEQVGRIHAHFLHRPALVAKLLAEILGVEHSFSGHARDIFVPDFRLPQLCRHASFILVCSEFARARLLGILGSDSRHKVVLCPHGIPVDEFAFCTEGQRFANRSVRLVSVSRLVAKKGVSVVLEAVAILQRRNRDVTCKIVGTGPEQARLARLARRLRLTGLQFAGEMDLANVKSVYAESDILVLGCRVASDGDQDGIPNVVLEAMAAGLPVVVSSAGGVTEAIRNRETGILVTRDSPQCMAAAIEELIDKAPLRDRLRRNARSEVTSRFDSRQRIAPIVALFQSVAECTPAGSA